MKRLMRLRSSSHLRDLCAETEFNRAQLIQPFFVVEGLAHEEPIPGLRGNVRHNIASALKMIEQLGAKVIYQPLANRNRDVIAGDVDEPKQHI